MAPDRLVVQVRSLGLPRWHLAAFPTSPMVAEMLHEAARGETFPGPVETLCALELTGTLLVSPASPAQMSDCLLCRMVMIRHAEPGAVPALLRRLA